MLSLSKLLTGTTVGIHIMFIYIGIFLPVCARGTQFPQIPPCFDKTSVPPLYSYVCDKLLCSEVKPPLWNSCLVVAVTYNMQCLSVAAICTQQRSGQTHTKLISFFHLSLTSQACDTVNSNPWGFLQPKGSLMDWFLELSSLFPSISPFDGRTGVYEHGKFLPN